MKNPEVVIFWLTVGAIIFLYSFFKKNNINKKKLDIYYKFQQYIKEIYLKELTFFDILYDTDKQCYLLISYSKYLHPRCIYLYCLNRYEDYFPPLFGEYFNIDEILTKKINNIREEKNKDTQIVKLIKLINKELDCRIDIMEKTHTYIDDCLVNKKQLENIIKKHIEERENNE